MGHGQLKRDSARDDDIRASSGFAAMRPTIDTFLRSLRERATRPGRGRFTALGIQGKLTLCFALMLFAGISLCSWLFMSKSSEALSDILGEQARQLSQTLAMSAEEPFLENKPEQLSEMSRDLLKGRNIVLVAYCDTSGALVAGNCRDSGFDIRRAIAPVESGGATQSLMRVHSRTTPALGPFLQVTAPILSTHGTRWAEESTEPEGRTRLLGYITVGVSQNSAQSQIRRLSLIALGVGCAVLVLSLPLAGGLIYRIFLPIRQLADATKRIAGGDYAARVATDRPDEIGVLAQSFNQMVQKIHEHQEELRRANQELEEKVRQRTSQLESSNERLSSEIAEKEDFLRAVSHDLNAPLRNIGGMAAMLLMKYRERFDEDIIHRLERIRKNVEVETDLIAELLELSRIKTRRHKMEPVDLDALVREVGELFQEDFEQKGIEFIVEGKLPTLTVERMRLRQVFQNLIDNAVKYMSTGPVRQIRIGHVARGDVVEFHVADTGIGIDAEDQTKVFHIFRRGKNCGGTVPGKGVGLSSVKCIVETYGGRIWVESKPGAGSTFRFTLDQSCVGNQPEQTGLAA